MHRAKSNSGESRNVPVNPLDKQLRKYFEHSIFPPELQRTFFSIAKELDTFEPLFKAAEDSGDRVQIFDTLDDMLLSGVFTKILPLIETASGQLGRFQAMGEQAGYDRILANQHSQIDFQKAVKRSTDFFKDFRKAVTAISEGSKRDSRPLLALVADEVSMGAAQRRFFYFLKKGNPITVFQDEQKMIDATPDLSPIVEKSLIWSKAVYRLSQMIDRKAVEVINGEIQLNPALIRDWLNDVDLAGVGGERYDFTSRALNPNGDSTPAVLHAPQGLHPLLIAGFEVFPSQLRNLLGSDVQKMVVGDISRINGELMVNGMFFTSLRRVFEFFGIPEVYEVLRKELLAQVYAKYEQDQITDLNQREALRELLGAKPQLKTPEVTLPSPMAPVAAPQMQAVAPDSVERPHGPLKIEGRLAGEYNPDKERSSRPQELGKMPNTKFKRKLLKCPGIKLRVEPPHFHLFSDRTGNKILTYNIHGGRSDPLLKRDEIREKLILMGVSPEEFLNAKI